MNILRTAVIAASLAVAGPALADGGAAFVYMPNLSYPVQDVAVTKTATIAPVQKPGTCTLLERSADVHPSICGTLAQSELVKRKLARDE